MSSEYEYGNWLTVVILVIVCVVFTLGFIRPKSKSSWRSYSIFMAYLVALFTEMFGIPLTIFFLVSLLGNRYPATKPFTIANSHLWYVFSGETKFIFILIHIIGLLLIIAALIIMIMGWKLIYKTKDKIVTDGIYKYIRHPQYLAIYMLIFAFLITLPTIPTCIMAPILFYMYYRLSLEEEKELEQKFGEKYIKYKENTPMFIPRLAKALS